MELEGHGSTMVIPSIHLLLHLCTVAQRNISTHALMFHLTQPESGNWTKLDPEVNSTDADERPTYR